MAEYERDPQTGYVRSSNGGSGGVIAILVVIVVLLVAGFLYFTQYGGENTEPDIELNIQTPDLDVPDVEIEGRVTPPRGGGEGR